LQVSRAQFEANLAQKIEDQGFKKDLMPFLPHGTDFDVPAAAEQVKSKIISKLPGEPWKREPS